MTAKPESIEIRVYNVGLGDCILIKFRSKDTASDEIEDHKVLIDFGSTGKNKDGPSLLHVAKQIVNDCKDPQSESSSVGAIVVTHRHRDHMSGFGGKAGKYLFENLHSKLIVQPWTENPDAVDPVANNGDANAAAAHLMSFRAAQKLTQTVLKEILFRRKSNMPRKADEEAIAYCLKNIPSGGYKFLDGEHEGLMNLVGENTEDIANEDAIEHLQNWKNGAAETEREYLDNQMETKLRDVIPNLNVDVLGPPSSVHWEEINRTRGGDELWKRLEGLRSGREDDKFVEFESEKGPYGVSAIFEEKYQVPDSKLRKDSVRWLAKHLDDLRGQQLLSFVRKLDEHLNNTSVVLLFEFGDFRMLFPGDAEVAAWQSINQTVDNIADKLRSIDLYKVGHHGSDNATPIESLWLPMQMGRDDSRPLHCVLSTQTTKFPGSIPNETLFNTMKDSSELHLVSTAVPKSSEPFSQPNDWKAETKTIKGKQVVMSYVREFSVVDNNPNDP